MPSSDDEQAPTGPEWFPDPTIKNAADQRFVAHIRSLAPGWATFGITPAHTTTIRSPSRFSASSFRTSPLPIDGCGSSSSTATTA
jgi:hypothetical protein